MAKAEIKRKSEEGGDGGLASRQLALAMLEDAYKGQGGGDAIEKQLAQSDLSARDKAFAMRLAMQVLRTRPLIDAMLNSYLKEPIKKEKAGFVTEVLRIGAAQLLWLETPPHAAVHSSVELVKQTKLKGFAGMVNAVLKRVAKDGKATLESIDQPPLLLPEWAWERWQAHYGEALAREIALCMLDEPPMDISVKADAPRWAEKLEAKLLPTGSVRMQSRGQVRQMEGFQEGAWWVQDAAAAIPAQLLLNKTTQDTPLIYDLCAAPGGKTAQLAAAGAKVIAVDRSEKRMVRFDKNMKRLNLDAASVVADLLTWEPQEKADGILLDAPCTATGTFRRQPEVLLHKSNADVEKLSELQRKILFRALDWLKPEGVLVYVTCSLEKEEGEAHMQAVLNERQDVTLLPVAADEVGGATELLTAQGALRTLPTHLKNDGGMDGFFAFRIIKH